MNGHRAREGWDAMNKGRIDSRALLILAAAVVGGFVGTTFGHGNTARAASGVGALPSEVFTVGNNINGLGATYQIQEVRGSWIRVVPFRSLDEHNAPPQAPRSEWCGCETSRARPGFLSAYEKRRSTAHPDTIR